MAVLEGNVAFANLDEHEEYQGQSTGKYSLVLSLEPADADKLADKGVKLRAYEGTAQGKPHPVHGTSTYLSKVKVLELAEPSDGGGDF